MLREVILGLLEYAEKESEKRKRIFLTSRRYPARRHDANAFHYGENVSTITIEEKKKKKKRLKHPQHRRFNDKASKKAERREDE